MQVNRCVSCMEETERYPCPHCGFDAGAQPQPGYALPRNTILCGKYLVGKVLGQGGFGITYVGWNLALEVKVAIKEYYPTGQVVRQNSVSSKLQWNDTARSETARRAGMESFLKEARKMARVDQIRQVVRVRDMFCENDTAYIIMDFVKGETLKVRLEREGPLPFGQAMDIFRPALAALEEVHKAGLIHRDLSPDNIMLEPEGGVRILDLGAAKDLTANRGASSMLVTKGGFSPLEQYGQRGGSGPWTDVYAMAATIYYTLTGILPPNAIDRLDGDELRWDLPGLRGLPSPAYGALQRALAVRAKDRTQSMGELLAGLEQPGEPEPKPEPEPEPMPEPEPKPEPQPEREPEPEPEPVPQSKKKGFWSVLGSIVGFILVGITFFSIYGGVLMLFLDASQLSLSEKLIIARIGAAVLVYFFPLRHLLASRKKAAGKTMVERVAARAADPKEARRKLALFFAVMYAAGLALMFVGAYFSDAGTHQAQRWLDNPTMALHLPAALSLLCVALYFVELVLRFLNKPPKLSLKVLKYAGFAHVALCAFIFVNCLMLGDILAIDLVYFVITGGVTPGVYRLLALDRT